MGCPYYRKVNLKNHPARVDAYCDGDSTGRLRIPSLGEQIHYCTTEQYPACEVFQAKQATLEGETYVDPPINVEPPKRGDAERR